jgi:hypothetical protein
MERKMEKYISKLEKGRYQRMEVLPLDLLWSVRHKEVLWTGWIFCVLLLALTGLLLLILPDPRLLLFIIVLAITAPIIYYEYEFVSGFSDILNALNLDLVDFEVEGSNTLRFDTVSFGRFWLCSEGTGGSGKAPFRMWIRTTRSPPLRYGWDLTLWEKDNSLQKYDTDKSTARKGGIRIPDVTDISSLREIRFDRGSSTNRIVAVLDEMWIYYKGKDIQRTLEALREIEQGL